MNLDKLEPCPHDVVFRVPSPGEIYRCGKCGLERDLSRALTSSQAPADDVMERGLALYEAARRLARADENDQCPDSYDQSALNWIRNRRDELAAAIPPSGRVEELEDALGEARASLNGMRLGHRVDLTAAVERIDVALGSHKGEQS